MQFQVPQFIETEDKIVGPFTLRQFAYIGAAGGISIFVFFLVESLTLWFVISAVFATAGLSLAFYKPYGRPLPALLFAALKFYWNPQTYVWQAEKKPGVKVPREEIEKEPKRGINLDAVISGFALKDVWKKLQTRSSKRPSPVSSDERYEQIQKLTGERRIARRVDYR